MVTWQVRASRLLPAPHDHRETHCVPRRLHVARREATLSIPRGNCADPARLGPEPRTPGVLMSSQVPAPPQAPVDVDLAPQTLLTWQEGEA